MTRLFVLLFGLLLGGIGAELYLQHYPVVAESCIVPHPVLNHSWVKGKACILPPEVFPKDVTPYSVVFNNESWREKEDIPLQKREGEVRIFFVGDSFTAGTCPQEKAMPRVVEELISKTSTVPLRVVNVGTPSYSPILYTLQLSHYVNKYKPDIIFISVDMTDVFDDFIYSSAAVRNKSGEIESIPPSSSYRMRYLRVRDGLRERPLWERLLFSQAEHSLVLELINRLFFINSGAPHPELPQIKDWCKDPWSIDTKARVTTSMWELRKLIRTIRSQQSTVYITGVPHRDQLIGNGAPFSSLAPFDAIKSASEQEGAVYVDSYEWMKAHIPQEGVDSIFIPGDMHYNERGYRVWGEGIAEVLLRDLRLTAEGG